MLLPVSEQSCCVCLSARSTWELLTHYKRAASLSAILLSTPIWTVIRFLHSLTFFQQDRLFPSCHSWGAVAFKAAVSHLAVSPSSFSHLLLSRLSHFFFFCSLTYSLALPPLCFLPNLFLALTPLCSTYLPRRLSSKEKWCFALFFFFQSTTSKNPYHRFYSVHQPVKASPILPPSPQSIRQQPASQPHRLLPHLS